MAVALKDILVTSRNLQDAIVSWKENGNLTYGQSSPIAMDHEPAETREKKGSPASPDSSNGFIPQLIK